MHFEVFSSRNVFGRKRWYWRLRAVNNEIMAQSAGSHGSAQSAFDACSSIRRHMHITTRIEVL